MKNRGSVQVVEMSFVLPVAMLIVMSLVYLAFAMFLYGHSQNLAQSAATKLCSKVGEEGLYWQLLGKYIDDESLNEITSELSNSLKRCAILPGINFDVSCTVTGKLHMPTANVLVKGTYYGKQIFKITVSKTAYKPKEFAETVDFGHRIESDFEELKGIYDKFF